MKVLAFLVFASVGLVFAQAPAPAQPAVPPQSSAELPDLPDSTVIAEFEDHTKFTMADFRRWVAALPPENQPMALRDPRQLIKGWAHIMQMAHLAEQEKLDEKSPYKEQIQLQRYYTLAQAEMSEKMNNILVDNSELSTRYETEKERFKQVKVSAIYIAFGEKGLKEEQAKAKAERLLAQIRKGADFAKLARENSDDETSKAKDGYFATLTPTDNIPDALRTAVFKLKAGETSEPVRQPNGFYLLKAQEVSYKPFSAVRDQIFSEVKNQKLQQWIDLMSKQAEPKFVNPTFPPPAPTGK